MSNVKQIAETIYSQISIETKMACGIRNLVCGQSDNIPFLQFKVLKGRHIVKVHYMPNDTYNVELIKLGNAPSFCHVQLEEAEEIYCDQLSSIIYHMVNK